LRKIEFIIRKWGPPTPLWFRWKYDVLIVVMIEREKIPHGIKADYQDKAGRADYCTRDTRPVPSLVEYQILLQWKARG